METLKTTSKKEWHDVDIKGRWKLLYKVGNEIGPEAFGGKHLGLYQSPFDGTKVYRRSVDDKPLNGFMMDKLSLDFNPDENLDHKYLINWMICHPEVTVEGIKDIPKKVLQNKIGNKVFLRALDTVEIEKFDEDDFIDRVVGLLSLDSGPKSVGIDKLRHILAGLNMPYQDNRFKGEAEKKALRSKLKKHIRSSIENARKVSMAIDNLDEGKENFQFKEMLKHKIIEDYGGQYKFNNVPLGTSFERVQAFFADHPEVKAEALQQLATFK